MCYFYIMRGLERLCLFIWLLVHKNKKLHVIFTDGKELAGVDAFIYVWNRTDGYGWLGKIIALPLIKQVAIILYSILAFALYWRFKLFNNN